MAINRNTSNLQHYCSGDLQILSNFTNKTLDTDGKLVRIEIATDITERKEAEIKLKQSEREINQPRMFAKLKKRSH